MSKARIMTAGAGGTQYNVLTSIDQGGGNKKQGLVSTTNTPTALDSHIRVRGGGHNRNWVFCMNQLGGVGRRWGQSSGPGNRAGVSAVCHRIARKRRQDYPAKPPGANVKGWGAAYKWSDWRTGDVTTIQFAGLLLWPSMNTATNTSAILNLNAKAQVTGGKMVGLFSANYLTDLSANFWDPHISVSDINTVALGAFDSKAEKIPVATLLPSLSQGYGTNIIYVFGGQGVGGTSTISGPPNCLINNCTHVSPPPAAPFCVVPIPPPSGTGPSASFYAWKASAANFLSKMTTAGKKKGKAIFAFDMEGCLSVTHFDSQTGSNKVNQACIDQVVTNIKYFIDQMNTINPPPCCAGLYEFMLIPKGDECPYPDIADKIPKNHSSSSPVYYPGQTDGSTFLQRFDYIAPMLYTGASSYATGPGAWDQAKIEGSISCWNTQIRDSNSRRIALGQPKTQLVLTMQIDAAQANAGSVRQERYGPDKSQTIYEYMNNLLANGFTPKTTNCNSTYCCGTNWPDANKCGGQSCEKTQTDADCPTGQHCYQPCTVCA